MSEGCQARRSRSQRSARGVVFFGPCFDSNRLTGRCIEPAYLDLTGRPTLSKGQYANAETAHCPHRCKRRSPLVPGAPTSSQCGGDGRCAGRSEERRVGKECRTVMTALGG